MKKLIAFIALACGLAAAPTAPVNNAVIQVNGVAQSGVLAGNGAGVAVATATQAQISTALDLIGSTRGSLLYKGAAGWSALTPGTSGQVLSTAGAGADPLWTTDAGGDVIGPVSSTLNALALFADTTGKLLANSDLTYSTPTLTVPSGFVISSAGTIALTAGSASDITLTATGTSTKIISAKVGSGDDSGFTASFNTTLSQTGSFALLDSGGSAQFGNWQSQSGGIGPRFVMRNASSVRWDTGFSTSLADAYVVRHGSLGNFLALENAGAIALTSFSNQNIALTMTGTGALVVTQSGTSLPTPQASSTFQFNSYGTIEGIATSPFMDFRRTNTSAASPSATLSGNGLGRISGKGYMATAYSGAVVSVAMSASQNWTDTATGSQIDFATNQNNTVNNGLTKMTLTNFGGLQLGISAAQTTTAWGTAGVMFSVAARTTTDSSSSGTVATAVANSFAVPTFNSTSVTTFTNAANLYIAGDVAATGNVTITNSYGLWNVGKTRLGGAVLMDGNLTFGTSASILNGTTGSIGLTATGTNQDITFAPSGTGNLVVSTGANVPSVAALRINNTGASPIWQAFTSTGTVLSSFSRSTNATVWAGGSGGSSVSVDFGATASVTLTPSGTGDVVFTGNGTTLTFDLTGSNNANFKAAGGLFMDSDSFNVRSFAGTTRMRISPGTDHLLLGGLIADGGGNKVLQLPGLAGVLNIGATANATIGVSADTTAGIMQFVAPTSGTMTFTTANALSATLSGGAAATLTGGAGNMTITAGTGNSRRIALQATNSSGTATDILSGTGNSTVVLGVDASSRTFIQLNSNATTPFIQFNQAAGPPATGATYYTFNNSSSSTSTSGTTNFVSLTPVYNQASGTSANTDFLINRTQTAVGSGAQLLIDAQVGSTSQFKVSNIGTVNALGQFLTTFGSSATAVSFGTVTGTGMWGGSTTLNFSTNGTNAIAISSTQNVTFTGTITKPGGASLIITSTALTDGAGAGAGTITNAPSAGNPTKWIGINDNGTTRYVPAW